VPLAELPLERLEIRGWNCYDVMVKTKGIIAGAALCALLLFAVMFLSVHRGPRRVVTVGQVKSVHSGAVTTMTFEITNNTTDTYVFHPFSIQVRDGQSWTTFQVFQLFRTPSSSDIDPGGVAFYSVDATNLPVGATVRICVKSRKLLSGVERFIKLSQLELSKPRIRAMSLNLFNGRRRVYGKTTEVFSEEWVEQDQ
jgi:hypothetical protein